MASILKGRVLGKGSYGTVYLAESIDGTLIPPIAIKSCLLQKSVSLHLEERSLIRLHGCPGIVQCFGSYLSFENGAVFYNLLLEYAARGSLWDLIQNGPTLCERDVQRYTGMILRGLTSMHLSGMVHCDLKPSNILVFPGSQEGFKHDQLKIADFGLVKEVGFLNECEDHWKFRFRGTPNYMSPESVARGQIGPALDVWSLGCIVVEMLTGKPAWWPRCQDIETLMYRLARLKESPKDQRIYPRMGRTFSESALQ
ncbi:Serine/threonine-protein kinase BCK1/SLK1/SSP31 [Morella rubra]|uniref:Serine/threonine-protein kinase BCK1/SLK1/SSP31 n=1 Tax=Morella rubra TaxID=262757 RepID=A0A6A1WMP4_9ROSI|nr:Serine/threonine-protein kinase BCK1/SLK1/SSP31 [Morella rubra]